MAALFYSVQFYGEPKCAIFADAQKVKGFKGDAVARADGVGREMRESRWDFSGPGRARFLSVASSEGMEGTFAGQQINE